MHSPGCFVQTLCMEVTLQQNNVLRVWRRVERWGLLLTGGRRKAVYRVTRLHDPRLGHRQHQRRHAVRRRRERQ